jgi:chemotaxis protein CheD
MNEVKPSSQRRPSIGPPAAAPRGSLLHYVTPGNLFAASEPSRVTTVVGSCVAICLWDPSTGVGGINHYLLPRCPDPSQSSGRFGDTAFQILVDRLVELGAARRSLQARLVGGACLISAFRDRDSHLGRQNVDLGLMLLRDAGIRLVQQETGGGQGRKIVFCTADGNAVIQIL